MSDPAVREMFKEKNTKIKTQAKLITALIKSLSETNQHVIELLEYSEIYKEVAHVWANAEDGMYKAREVLNSEAVKQFKGEMKG